MKVKFSIRYKFLSVTTALLVSCVGVYLWLASSEFKNDKRSLVFDFNKSLVTNIASDAQSFLISQSDKMRLMAFFYREPENKRQQLIEDLMRENKDLVFVGVSDRFQNLNKTIYMDEEFARTYSLTESFWFVEMVEVKPAPLGKVQSTGEAIWNATVEGGPPLIGIGKSVIEEDERGIPYNQYAVVGYVRADRMIDALKQGEPNEVFLASLDGELLAHTDYKKMVNPKVGSDPLIKIAEKNFLENKLTKSVMDYSDGEKKFLAAYARTLGGQTYVFSRVAEAVAFQVVDRLVFRSLLFASMIVTLAFLVAIFFSRSLTRPIDTLVSGMKRVSDGDLSSSIQIRSKDEIAMLALSFNRMIEDLKASRQELEDINRDLENKVKERTRELELQNQAVKEAQEALLRTTRLAAVGEVAGQAAHEVLNPLTSIIARLNNLKKRVENERVKEAHLILDINQSWEKDYSEGGFSRLIKSWQNPSQVKQGASLWQEDTANIKSIGENIINEFKSLSQDTDFLIQEAERIGRIVNSFRSLGAQPSQLKKVSLNALCEKSVRIMADLAEQNGIKTYCELVAQSDSVILDEDEFLQVMTNLLRNSLQAFSTDHSKEKFVKVKTEYSNGRVLVHVIDNGRGITETHQKKIFEKNFTTKEKNEGTGIGLSISRRLIRAFKGDIRLHSSNLEKGTHFIVDLPHCEVVMKDEVA